MRKLPLSPRVARAFLNLVCSALSQTNRFETDLFTMETSFSVLYRHRLSLSCISDMAFAINIQYTTDIYIQVVSLKG